MNPHLGLTLSWDGVKEIAVNAYKADWQKWLPSDPTSAHWYDYMRFERRIAAQIAHDQDRKKDTLIREFLVEFRGLSGTAKQKTVLDKVGGARVSLSSLYGDRGFNKSKITKLLSAMQEETKPVQPKQLGGIGWWASTGHRPSPAIRSRPSARAAIVSTACWPACGCSTTTRQSYSSTS